MSGVEARETMESAVRRELFGPPLDGLPRGKALDCSTGTVHFQTKEDSWGIWHEASTGEEVLTESDPLRRYGIGILHNGATTHQPGSKSNSDLRSTIEDDYEAAAGEIDGAVGLSANEETPDGVAVHLDATSAAGRGDADDDDFDLTDANSFKPSAMAISFQVDAGGEGKIEVSISGAYYDKLSVQWPGLRRPRTWWVRRPVALRGVISNKNVIEGTNRLNEITLEPDGDYRIAPLAKYFCRTVPRQERGSSLRLITLAVMNTSLGSGSVACLFQMGLSAQTAKQLTITPYPDIALGEQDDEEKSIAMLYRENLTYAIGHGCAADWVEAEGVATSVRADPMPVFEVPSLTPDIYENDSAGVRRPVTVSMNELAQGSQLGAQQVERVIFLYENWIRERELEIPRLPQRFKEAAVRHLRHCSEALVRMRDGWEVATSDPIGTTAFRIANEAMLYQQLRSNFDRREAERRKDGRIVLTSPHPSPKHVPGKGNWRPFQIAFILATLPELVNRSGSERQTVDLIFFPTGGGKTEAYLGAAAISLVSRRLRDPEDGGTDALMRYTLRLLTSQQFLRAAALVCVLEDIRSKRESELGSASFGIGVWLGSSSTPNTWNQAVENLRQMGRDGYAQNKFLLLRCPWCGAEMGPKPKPGRGQDVLGYQQVGKKVELRCIDDECRFGGRRKLPVHVVDEEIYEVRPSIVIGTVDKFAMMAWRPEARAIFGLDDLGDRSFSPPGLIIQDELHLISGPLGSMVGLYEPIVAELCTDVTRDGERLPPKIIASTATIRRYEDQVRALYGREKVALFPPQGLTEGHSFFAEPATCENGDLEPGRRYMGILSASLGSTQTVQVRVAAATLQGVVDVPEEDRDGYWTNLNFLNSLRELGNTVSLIQSDIPDYVTGLRRREELTSPRWPRIPMELTSRRRSDDIPKAIEQLQIPYGEPGCVDICLASSIIEVGVDIDRLALMTIVGQPKTTAQYIQVSGRVGRKPGTSPGLVLTIYGAAKPRDRSHYERFRTYHERLYAQVEPTSVTPFAVPVLRRALHAAAVSFIRQAGEIDMNVFPFPEADYDAAMELLRQRAEIVDPAEVPRLKWLQAKRAKEWHNWNRTEWNANSNGGEPSEGLMRYAGTLPDLKSKATVWDIPTSMRNVDAECRLQVSLDYAYEDGMTEGDS